MSLLSDAYHAIFGDVGRMSTTVEGKRVAMEPAAIRKAQAQTTTTAPRPEK